MSRYVAQNRLSLREAYALVSDSLVKAAEILFTDDGRGHVITVCV